MSDAVAYFGKSWKITVQPQGSIETWTVGNSAWAPETLKCTFEVEQFPFVKYWFGDVTIYNALPAMRQVIRAGDVLSIEAGFQSPPAGLIFNGEISQVLWERANATENTLHLHCNVGLFKDKQTDVSTTIPAGYTPAAAVKWVADAATAQLVAATPATASAVPPSLKIEYLDPILEAGPTNPRGEPFAGKASVYFCRVAAQNQLFIWQSWNGFSIRSLAPADNAQPETIYMPAYSTATKSLSGVRKPTLLGTPQQTEQGVVFRVMLDPSVRLGQVIALDGVLLAQIVLLPGQLPPLDPNGVYVVCGIRHLGDTRGNEWETEITGLTGAAARIRAMAR